MLPQALHLDVEACSVEPQLMLEPAYPRPPGRPYHECDFGALPVGQRCVRVLQLANVGACRALTGVGCYALYDGDPGRCLSATATCVCC